MTIFFLPHVISRVRRLKEQPARPPLLDARDAQSDEDGAVDGERQPGAPRGSEGLWFSEASAAAQRRVEDARQRWRRP